MAKSARASRIKKNNQVLKRRVFGPVEAARNERLHTKMLKLANQPKPPPPAGSTDATDGVDTETRAVEAVEGLDMDVDEDERATAPTKSTTDAPVSRSNNSLKRQKAGKAARIEKKRHRKARNSIAFAKHPKKQQTGKR